MSKISLGVLVITDAAKEAYATETVVACLVRHATGDWGDTPKEDAQMNDEAVSGERILSSYTLDGGSLWIITEGRGQDRVTTCLRPADY